MRKMEQYFVSVAKFTTQMDLYFVSDQAKMIHSFEKTDPHCLVSFVRRHHFLRLAHFIRLQCAVAEWYTIWRAAVFTGAVGYARSIFTAADKCFDHLKIIVGGKLRLRFARFNWVLCCRA